MFREVPQLQWQWTNLARLIQVSLTQTGSTTSELILLSGDKGIEYPKRFFARDFAGNRLEFSL